MREGETEVLWQTLESDEVARRLKTDPHTGLDQAEVSRRLKQHGPNFFSITAVISNTKLILNQLKSSLVIVLICAGLLTLILGEFSNSLVIFLVVAINTTIGWLQEKKALAVLDEVVTSHRQEATVLRGSKRQIVPIEGIVPGDVVLLTAGDVIPADARVITSNDLSVNESILTGEWLPVYKQVVAVDGTRPLAEQASMVWRGSQVVSGGGRAVVTQTGETTVVGRLAASLTDVTHIETPFERSIHGLSRYLVIMIIVACSVIVLLGLWRGVGISHLVLMTVAVAVAAIPAGLPIAVTVVLAVGARSILKQGGALKNLLSVETLGSTTVIMTDKTGTLTRAEMSVESIIPRSDIVIDREAVLSMAVMAADAFVQVPATDISPALLAGRPIEKAIIQAGLQIGLRQETLFDRHERVDYHPFDSKHRFSASLHRLPRSKRHYLYVAGAPETILAAARSIYRNGLSRPISAKDRRFFETELARGAKRGMKFLAVAYRTWVGSKLPPQGEALTGLVFGGLIGFHDPLRADVREAIKQAKLAGTRVVMVTGDNELTAREIAREAGITPSGRTNETITGDEFMALSPVDQMSALNRVSVYARMLPEAKLNLLKLYQAQGEIVAMTGDGVNDAPALRHADIGIALQSGSAVARESADLILMNDSFSVIIAAITGGRKILDNLKKIVAYLLSTSFSEIILVSGSLVLGWPLPVLPSQILWNNVVGKGTMTFAFAFEEAESDVLHRNPKSYEMRGILTESLRRLIMIMTVVTGTLTLLIYAWLRSAGWPLPHIQTVLFIILSLDSLFFAFSLKNLSQPIWRIKLRSNPYLLGSFALSLLVLGSALFVPAIKNLLQLASLELSDLVLVAVVGVINLLLIESVKYLLFWSPARHTTLTKTNESHPLN